MIKRPNDYATAFVLITWWLLAIQTAVGQETVFFTSFEYDEEPLVIEPLDLNGATDQVGEWSGLEFPESFGQFAPDSIVFVDNPYGGKALYYDRLTGDDGTSDRENVEPNLDFTGSFFADLTEAVLLEGAQVSFDIGSRRFSNNHNKTTSVIGRDSNGEESFHLRISTHNDNAGSGVLRRRLGVRLDEGATENYDLPTIDGEDADNDLGGIGDAPHGVNAPIGTVQVQMGADGYKIFFAHNEQRSNANSYETDVIPYNGSAVDLAQIEFTYEASSANGRTSAAFLDNVLVIGRKELLPGDFNGDGLIDIADFTVMASHFQTGTEFSQGDNNFDGIVDLVDFVEFKQSFLAQAQGELAAVPEPSSAVLLSLLAVVLLSHARRRAGRLL